MGLCVSEDERSPLMCTLSCQLSPVSTVLELPVQPQLTDQQWLLIADLFPSPIPDPRVDTRLCVEGILWVLRSGARWKDMPRCFPSYATCWRRFEQWSNDGVWENVWERLLCLLDNDKKISWQQGIADGTFASAKKGGIL